MELVSVKIGDDVSVNGHEKEFVEANRILAKVEDRIDDGRLKAISNGLSKLMISDSPEKSKSLVKKTLNDLRSLLETHPEAMSKGEFKRFHKLVMVIANGD